MNTLETYLRHNHQNGNIDHALRTVMGPNGEMDFYIHPIGVDGVTLNLTVTDNTIENIPDNHGAGSRPPK